MLASGEHDAAKRSHLLLADRVTDHRERLLPNLVGRREIIGRREITVVDLLARHKALDVDRMRALDLDLGELVILDFDVLTFGELVAAPDVVLLNRITGDGINVLLLESVPGLFVDAVERDTFRAR